MKTRRNLPQRKVTISTLAGAVVTVVVAISKNWGMFITPEVASALTVITSFLLGYLIPER